MRELKYAETNQIVKNALNMEVTNTITCAKMGKDTVSIFNNNIANTKNEPLYILVPAKTERTEDNRWLHDLSTYKIYRLTVDVFKSLGIDINNLPDERTRIKLNEDWLIFTSNVLREQEVIIDRDLTVKEHVCIVLRVPESGTEWIDTLIKKSLQNG